jgi:hypothetical protein
MFAAPNASCAITALVAQYAPETPRLDRYRNELAANTLGVPAARANSTGLATLRALAAAAPPPQSDAAFLPQLRAVNLVKACQKWVEADDVDVDEALDGAMTLVFLHAAPVLQHVPGAHWEFIFDVMENNLEVSVRVPMLAAVLTPLRTERGACGGGDAADAGAHAALGARVGGPVRDEQGAAGRVDRAEAEDPCHNPRPRRCPPR